VRCTSSGRMHFSMNLISGISDVIVVWVLDGELGQGKCTTAAAFGGGRGGTAKSYWSSLTDPCRGLLRSSGSAYGKTTNPSLFLV
jgi:hypothetical protein